MSVQREIELERERIPDPTIALKRLKMKPVNTWQQAQRTVSTPARVAAALAAQRSWRRSHLLSAALEAERVCALGLGGRARGARREGCGGPGRRERAEVAHGTGMQGVCCAASRCEEQELHPAAGSGEEAATATPKQL